VFALSSTRLKNHNLAKYFKYLFHWKSVRERDCVIKEQTDREEMREVQSSVNKLTRILPGNYFMQNILIA
jgi:hypothetical protein